MNSKVTSKTELVRSCRSVVLYHKYGIKQQHVNFIASSEDAREIGRIMAHKVAKKLKLNLGI